MTVQSIRAVQTRMSVIAEVEYLADASELKDAGRAQSEVFYSGSSSSRCHNLVR
jgi:hypothetical protein